MADPTASVSNFVEPSEPAAVYPDHVEPQGAPVDETEIFDSPDISKIPLKQSEGRGPEDEDGAIPPERQTEPQKKATFDTGDDAAKDNSVTPEKADDKPKPLFETQQEPETPFESKEAKELRAQAVPAVLKGAAAKSFSEAKEKWAGIVEAKDTQLHKLEKKHKEEVAALVKRHEELEGKISHLSGYESVIDFQASDKFKNEYEAPVKAAEQELIDFMKDAGATEEGIKELQASIGDNKYLNAAMAELFKNNPGIASQFSIGVSKLRELRRKQDAALNEARTNHGKLIEQRRAEATTKTSQFEQAVSEAIKTHINSFTADKEPAFPFLRRMKAPPGADQQTLEQVAQHNKFVEQNLTDLNTAIKNDDPKDRVKFAVGFMTAVVQQNVIKNLNERLKAAEDYVARVKKAGAPPDKATGATSAGTPQGDDPMAHFDSTIGRR